MVTAVDERNGVVKTYWKDIRERVSKVEPRFAEIVDELNPGEEFPIYLAYFPYGSLVGDAVSQFLPKQDGGYYRLSDPNAPKDVIMDLGYGTNSAPLGMVLEKGIEYFIDLPSAGITIPRLIFSPGYFFPLARVLSKKSNRIYPPNAVLSSVAGARSVFMLPNIGCMIHHANLQRDFNIQGPPPKSLYDHWHLFKEIINSSTIESDWRSCILYFSKHWIDMLHTDKAWHGLKIYLHELGWQYSEYPRNAIYYDTIFSLILQKRNLRPNPYLTDTARHLFTTALGAAGGYAPACDNSALPADLLQKVFIESYGLKKYIPTIMQPTTFIFEKDIHPIYYSLQHPSTHTFSPKSRKISSTLFEMHELEHMMSIFKDELAGEKSLCADTIMGKIAQSIEFGYFHNKQDRHNIVQLSDKIPEFDSRFLFVDEKIRIDNSQCATDGKFLRGCVSISTNQK